MLKPVTLIVAITGGVVGARALCNSRWIQANAPAYREQLCRWFLWDVQPEHWGAAPPPHPDPVTIRRRAA